MTSFISRTKPIKACSLSLDAIKKLYSQLQQSVEKAAQTDISKIKQLETTSDEDFAIFKEELKSHYVITVVINGDKGETLVERNSEVFSSPNLPNKITSIYFDSAAYHNSRYNVMPQNWFSLNLDFSSPPLLDWRNAVSEPTPNASIIKVQGDDETWVAGVFDKINQTIDNNSTYRGFLHKPFIYDLGLLLFGLPIAFYVTHRFASHLSGMFSESSEYLQFASHVYIYFTTLILYRILFGYTKWAFPKVELSDGKSIASTHRKWWIALIAAVIAGFARDLVKSGVINIFN